MYNSNSTLNTQKIGYEKFAALPVATTEFQVFANMQTKAAQDRKIAAAYTRMAFQAYGTTDPVNPGTYA